MLPSSFSSLSSLPGETISGLAGKTAQSPVESPEITQQVCVCVRVTRYYCITTYSVLFLYITVFMYSSLLPLSPAV